MKGEDDVIFGDSCGDEFIGDAVFGAIVENGCVQD
jgi:hypothetical protein